MLHEVWGLSVPVTALVVCLADCGYITAAPHLHHRIADPVVTDGKFTRARRYHDISGTRSRRVLWRESVSLMKLAQAVSRNSGRPSPGRTPQ